ncbi:MAG: hypothetical protein AAFZ87_05435 [Planctomycetota bacterium]
MNPRSDSVGRAVQARPHDPSLEDVLPGSFDTASPAATSCARPRKARARAGLLRAAAITLLAANGAGCAFSNFDFAEISSFRGDARGAKLAEGLSAEEAEKQDEDTLYDVAMFPLARTRLHVYSESGDDGVDEGHTEMDMKAYLPLFGFVDATMTRYDERDECYERHEYDSYLWGLFSVHREEIDTQVGVRKQTKRTFLWLFDWSSSPKYVEPPRLVDPPDATASAARPPRARKAALDARR